MHYHNIPEELKRLNQWVCWKLIETDDGKDTKIPYCPRTGWQASTTNKETWSTFDECVTAANAGLYNGIGFVFTRTDEYCGIDLDAPKDGSEQDPALFARQRLIFDQMDSYAEMSPSGKGAHIIVKASVPVGRKRAMVEVYSHERYFTFTGNVIENKTTINARQDIVDLLWNQMGAGATTSYYEGTLERPDFDANLIAKMSASKNGALFDQLWAGDFSNYPSQSEADQALMNIIAFWTQNRGQCIDIFRQSGLANREKAFRDKYMAYTLDRAFDQMLPPIDMDGAINEMNAAIEAARNPAPIIKEPTVPTSSEVDGFDMDYWRTIVPDGIIRHMRDFTFESAVRPVAEIALVTALALTTGIAGRAYNVSKTGLNQYFIMLAETGRGKEAMDTAISTAMAYAANGTEFPALWHFIGPRDMTAGPSLLRQLAERDIPSFLTVTGEIGTRLQRMSADNASYAEITLREVLLDLYNKSGANQTVRPTAYSKTAENIGHINAPNFTWLGESVPTEFYKSLDQSQISSGLIPRFTMVEYNGIRVPYNYDHVKAYPSLALTKSIQELGNTALATMQGQKVVHVQFTPQAVAAERLVNEYADWHINKDSGVLVHLWNRHHIKVLKTAALLAVSANCYSPVVEEWQVMWANSLIMTGTMQLMRRFENGEVGIAASHDVEQVAAVKKVFSKYMNQAVTLKPTEQMLWVKGVISRSFITQSCHRINCFQKDKLGSTRAIGRTLEELVKWGWIEQMGKKQSMEEFSTSAELYVIKNAAAILAPE